MALLAGGVGGSTVPFANPASARRFAEGYRSDPNIPVDPDTLKPTSNRMSERTARIVQSHASDPQAAATRIRERTADASTFGDPVSASGIASDDPGLIALERGARLRGPVPFQESDQTLRDAAQNRVTGLRDPGADQSAATRFAQGRPGELQAARDADALPLLRQAEASGAVVDAQPVAALIDQKLTTVKRPAVRNALTMARGMLNRVGTDELDDSVSGLYETRKAVNDIIEGRTDDATGRFAKSELIDVRDALDEAINAAAPEFGQYLTRYKAGSRPLDVFEESKSVAKLLEDDPRNVAQRIFGGRSYGTEKTLDEINSVIGSNPEAKRAWRAAVAEVLADKVTTTNTALTGGPDGPVSIAKLQSVFKQHKPGLAKVFSPGEMESLRRAHKVLEPLGNLSRQATVGSPTAENLVGQTLWNALGTALTVHKGAVFAGMIMHRLRRAVDLAPELENMTPNAKAQRLISRMWFDPELAAHLLERPVSEVWTPRWNAKLFGLLGAAEASRQSSETDDPRAWSSRGKPNPATGGDETLEAIFGDAR